MQVMELKSEYTYLPNASTASPYEPASISDSKNSGYFNNAE